MNSFLYGVGLQWKLDIRSKSLLITCYLVPLLFFAVMGGIFTSINPISKETLIQSMTIMGVSTGAFIGIPPSLVEIYGSDIKKVYKANHVPLSLGLISIFISSFLHLMIMSLIIYIVAPIAFDATLPSNPIAFFAALALYIIVSVTIGCILGLAIKNQSKLTMISQIFFLPSIMLSGIMFPAEMLPKVLGVVGKVLPATWGYLLMQSDGLITNNLFPLGILFIIAATFCILFLKKLQAE